MPRPSPTVSATCIPADCVLRGNDGRPYVCGGGKALGGGKAFARRWAKVPARDAAASEPNIVRMSITLAPTLLDGGGEALAPKRVPLTPAARAVLCSPEAGRVVLNTLSSLTRNEAKKPGSYKALVEHGLRPFGAPLLCPSVTLGCEATPLYHVSCFVARDHAIDSAARLESMLADNYGDNAIDTWALNSRIGKDFNLDLRYKTVEYYM